MSKYESLVLAGFGELADPDNGIMLTTDLDFGGGEPDVGTIARLLLDGSVQSGDRTENRAVVLPLQLWGTDVQKVIDRRDLLVRALNAASFTLIWRPPGLTNSVIFECFRASAITEQTDFSGLDFAEITKTITTTFTALPFTRSVNPVTLGPTSSDLEVIETLAAPLTLTAWKFLDGPSDINTLAAVTAEPSYTPPGSSAVKITNLGFFGPDHFGNLSGESGFRLARTGLSLDLSDVASLSFPIAGILENLPPRVIYGLILTDSAGRKASWGVPADWIGPAGDVPWYADINAVLHASPALTVTLRSSAYVTLSIALFESLAITYDAGFDLSDVAAWTLDFVLGSDTENSLHTMWFGEITAHPGGVPTSSGPYTVQTFAGVGGTARTPIGLQVAAVSSSITSLLLSRVPAPRPGYNPILDTPTAHGTDGANAGSLGGHDYIFDGLEYQIPAQSLAGSYMLATRVHAPSDDQLITATFTVGDMEVSAQTQMPADLTGGWNWVYFGPFTLPPGAVPAENATATVTLSFTSVGGAGSPHVDSAMYLVDQAGESILIDCGTDDHVVYFLDSPSAVEFAGQLYAGDEVDRSDGLSVAQHSVGAPVIHLDPGVNSLLIVAVGASSGVQTNVTYYERYFQEAAA